jgi:hypothetical protein
MEQHDEVWCDPDRRGDAVRLYDAVRAGWQLTGTARSEYVGGQQFIVYPITRSHRVAEHDQSRPSAIPQQLRLR